MPEAVKAVLFDLYNTLIDIRTEERADDVWEAMALHFAGHGLRAEPSALESQFSYLVTRQQEDSPERHAEIDMPGIFRELLATWGHPEPRERDTARLFRILTMRRLRLFPDTLPTLQALRGKVKLGLVSDAQPDWLESEMLRLGLDGCFDAVVVSGNHGYRKPDPRLFERALHELGADPREAVMIGDSPYRDVHGAQQAGVRGCLVTRHAPFETADEGVVPDLVVESLVEFTRWLESVDVTLARA